MDKVRTLSRSYARAIAGTPLATSFDPTSADFFLKFTTNPDISDPTEIYLNSQWYYPKGYIVTISPESAIAKTVKMVRQNLLFLYNNQTLTPQTVEVSILPIV